MLISRCLIILTLAISLSACTRSTIVRHSNDYGYVLNREKNMLLLPAQAKVTTSDTGFKRDRMYNYESFIEPVINETLSDTLREKGYRVERLYKKDLKAKKLYRETGRLSSLFNERVNTMYASLLQDIRLAYNLHETVGDSAPVLYRETGKGIFVLASYNEMVKTSGARVRDVMIDALLNTGASKNAESATLIVGIIEAKTGRILWTNTGTIIDSYMGGIIDKITSDNDMDIARDKVKKLVKSVLRALPDRSALMEDMKKTEEALSKK